METKDTPPRRRQHLWLVRYGLTHPGLVEGIGPYDSDLHDPVGTGHAAATGARLASGDGDPASVPTAIFSDPFLRCMRTADAICRAIHGPGRTGGEGAVRVHVEEGTTEWQVPSLLVDPRGVRTRPRTVAELAEMLPDTVDAAYASVNPQGPDRVAGGYPDEDGGDDVAPRFPETEPQLRARCAASLSRILATVEGGRSLAIVGHAPCLQYLALCLEGSATPAEASGLGPWSCGGVTRFSRPVGEDGAAAEAWSLDVYSDTEHMPGEYKEGTKGAWSLPSFQK